MEENRICPDNHMAKAILVTVFCCVPFGIAAIVNASQVSSAFAMGNYNEALAKSNNANKWANVALGCGIAWIVIYAVIMVVSVLAGTL